MNDFEPLLKKEEEKLNLNSTDTENFSEPSLNEEKTIEEPAKNIEAPIDITSFEEPAIKKEEPNFVPETTTEVPIDITSFEEPAIKKEEPNFAPEETTEVPIDVTNFEEPAIKKEENVENNEKEETQNVTLEELNHDVSEKSSPKTKKISNKALLTTYIFGAITLFFVLITTRSFYFGFKYYEEAHPNLSPHSVQTNQ